jgi:hypothetical protein
MVARTIHRVSEELKIPLSDLNKKTRKHSIVSARYMVFSLLEKRISVQNLQSIFKEKYDRTTVLYGIESFKNNILTNDNLKKVYDKLKSDIDKIPKQGVCYEVINDYPFSKFKIGDILYNVEEKIGSETKYNDSEKINILFYDYPNIFLRL